MEINVLYFFIPRGCAGRCINKAPVHTGCTRCGPFRAFYSAAYRSAWGSTPLSRMSARGPRPGGKKAAETSVRVYRGALSARLRQPVVHRPQADVTRASRGSLHRGADLSLGRAERKRSRCSRLRRTRARAPSSRPGIHAVSLVR